MFQALYDVIKQKQPMSKKNIYVRLYHKNFIAALV